MGQQYSELSEKHITFISRQKVFFVGTATGDSRVNISPKGMDSLKIIDDKCLVWLNVTGSGNETAAHVQVDPRMTIMFTAFEGNPMILRIYGTAEAIHQNDENWDELYSLFNPLPGARQIFKVSIEMVQTSCGMAVPYFDYSGERNQLKEWAEKKGNEGIREYWRNKNQESIDGIPTNILEKNV
ncbi:pyridoxamine 5'-phosphate oxidase [Oleiphilus messinensis]|uniref:Pyridoxamine 5'-phosphate oxidase n=1 Tax=Oleiphilus messinensis TaxID=141451 RepID=A0A1Y0IAC3_9GAMM|nr:pyridoxamine 5'-phosphate oxidase family protein [Oleiphilus messinensis]ARU56425.1 pyridoxamine 5'-phosphate oxidase [Oleiphilus messinensis]